MRNALALAGLAGLGIVIAALATGLLPGNEVGLHAPRWLVLVSGLGLMLATLALAAPGNARSALALAVLLAGGACLWQAATAAPEYFHGGLFADHDKNALVARTLVLLVGVGGVLAAAVTLLRAARQGSR